MAFVKGKSLREDINNARIKYKIKIGRKFCTGNVRRVWDGLNAMMGRGGENDFNLECDRLCGHIAEGPPILFTEDEVAASLARLKTNKALGCLKGCAYKSHRGTGDAILTLVNTVANHLQQPKIYARFSFICQF